ncbi:transcriptional regulator family: Fungal Specific TF [Aspergillus niger]|nr:transcriptional regulator family: Fungal Specific TF [Aspergillus niger]KAI2842038.1 transcriptional regulator family: Fungal Specific TF [Aspergillus niger]KAI2879519.1 transcriptional regulator family: Fungal Specific TF [Aspergillus niger]KAI2884230.1 transcriptional regulator family: Fungal Specific TF [Aspergillus niger]GKZ87733.1 hypothetical protein AnigIFM59636_005648 [Aspergillus niger]
MPSPSPKRSIGPGWLSEPLISVDGGPELNQAHAPIKPSGSDGPIPGRSEDTPEMNAPRPLQQARRRNRVIHSCLECRRRKLKCDRTQPCLGCRSSGLQCAYIAAAAHDAQFRQKLVQMKDAKDALDSSLTTSGDTNLITEEEDPGCGADDYLEPTPLATQDAAYASDAEDDTHDIGIRVGRMRLNERVGGLYRPRIADELSHSLQYLQKRENHHTSISIITSSTLVGSSGDYMMPGRSFIVPSVNLALGPTPWEEPLAKFVPARHIADKLLERYWVAVHPVARILHRPTFAQRYETLWELVESGHEVPPSLSAIVCAILFSATLCINEAGDLVEDNVPREILKYRLLSGTEVSLGRAQLLQSTRAETLQAFVAYLLTMCLDEVSRAHSALVGMAIRLAECMGLHRDPAEYGFSPAECQTRRLIWFQICYLDVRTSEIQGPRPFIQPDGFTTKLPFDLSSVAVWNDTIFSMIRFECQEMHRECLILRTNVDRKKLSLTSAIVKLEQFRTRMDNKYGPLLCSTSPQQPTQRLAALVLKLLESLLYVCLLHRYMNSVEYQIPDRLRQIVLSKGTDALEAAVELESAQDLRPWSWYSRSYHQYHTALLLLCEVFFYPMRKEVGRIWRCLDFIFAEPLSQLHIARISEKPTLEEIIQIRDLKSRYLLTLITERMRAYQSKKGFRLSSQIQRSKLVAPHQVSVGSDLKTILNRAHETPGSTPCIHDESSCLKSGQGAEGRSNDNLGKTSVSADALRDPPHTWVVPSANFSEELLGSQNSLHGSVYGPNSSINGPVGDNTMHVQPSDVHGAPKGATAETLEIDWSFWDTVFPVQINDGILDIEMGTNDIDSFLASEGELN